MLPLHQSPVGGQRLGGGWDLFGWDEFTGVGWGKSMKEGVEML